MVTKIQTDALLVVSHAALTAHGYGRPSVAVILQTVRDAATLVGLDPNHDEIVDSTVRHIIAEGELAKEFNHG